MKPKRQRTVTRTPKGKSARFARIENTTLQDKALSFRARGVLAYVLSKPDDWKHSAERFAANGTEGVDAVRSALSELKRSGYAVQCTGRDEAGRLQSFWVFRERPDAENPDPVENTPSGENPDPAPDREKPAPGRPASGEPGFGQPAPGKAGPLETTVELTTVEQTTDTETTGGQGTPPVPFPWAGIQDLPQQAGAKLRALYPRAGDAEDVFTVIKGREITFKARHPINDWLAVFIAALERENRSDGGKGSSYASRRTTGAATDDWDGLRVVGAEPVRCRTVTDIQEQETSDRNEPSGWQEFLATERPDTAFSPGRAKHAKRWAELPLDAQNWIRDEMAKGKDKAA